MQAPQGSDFDEEEFNVSTLRYHDSNTFCPQFGIEEDTFSEYSVDQPAPRPLLRSRPPMDFSSNWQHLAHGNPPSLTSGLTVYSSLGSVVAPKAASSISLLSRLSIEAIAALTIPELCYNAHYCELRDSHDYISQVLASYLRKDLQVGGTRAARGVNTSLISDTYRSTSLIYYEVFSLNFLPQHYHHAMTPWDHLWCQAIQYPNIRNHNLVLQLSTGLTTFSVEWRHHLSGQNSSCQVSCGTFETVQRIHSMALSSQKPTRVDQRCILPSTLKMAHWSHLRYTITYGTFQTWLFASSSRNSARTLTS